MQCVLTGACAFCINLRCPRHMRWNGPAAKFLPFQLSRKESIEAVFHWLSVWSFARLSWRPIEVNCADEYDLTCQLPLHRILFLPVFMWLSTEWRSCHATGHHKTSSYIWQFCSQVRKQNNSLVSY